MTGTEQVSYAYELFICYAGTDENWTEEFFIPNLGVAKERIITRDQFRAGVDKVVEYERAVTSSRYTLLIFSPALLADMWGMYGESIASYYKVVQRPDRLLPLIKEHCELPERLGKIIPLDFTDEGNYDKEFAHLRELLEQPEPVISIPRCPYPGMKPFTKEDARFFYGRKEEIDKLKLRLRKQNYLFVIGPSGSGKSSLIFAGLVPELEKKQPGQWLVKSLRPGQTTSETPMQKLEKVLGEESLKDSPTVEQYRQSVNSLLAQENSEAQILLIIDQFEELFAPSTTIEQAQLFIAAIKNLRQIERISVILAMRADFYPDLMNSELWPLQEFERVEIAPLRGERLREAIVTPAANCGVYVEAKLVKQLLIDAAEEPGVLPLLQETMRMLWDKMECPLLTLKAYEKLGEEASKIHPSGLSVAIALHADATLAELSKNQSEQLSKELNKIARRIFIRLVQFGEGRADTRRQQLETKLRSAKDNASLFQQTLEHLISNRLLTPSSEEGKEERTIDIAHEALIEGWLTFQNWLKQWRQAEQTRRKLEIKGKNWEDLQREGGLLDEVELKEAKDWLSSPDAAELGYPKNLLELVKASSQAIQKAIQKKEEDEQREYQLLRERIEQEKKACKAEKTKTRVAIIATALVSIVAGIALVQWNQAIQGEINTLNALSDAYISENKNLEALITSVKAGEKFNKPTVWLLDKVRLLPDSIRIKTIATLAKAVYEVQEFNRLEGHSDGVWSVNFSSDGQVLASTSDDKTIKLWSNDGELLWSKNGHSDRITSVSFSPNSENKIIVSGSRDHTIKLWSDNGNLLKPLAGHSKPVNNVIFSHNGEIIASASDDRTIKLWNKNGELIKTLEGHEGAVTSVSFSPDGQTLASASWDKTVKLWNLSSYEELKTLNHSNLVKSVSFSPDGKFLVSASKDGTIKVWDKAGETFKSCKHHRKTVNDVSFSKDGQTIASASEDNTLKLWSIKNGILNCTPLKTFEGHRSSVKSVSFSPNLDNEIIVSAGDDNTVRLWNSKDNPFLKILKDHFSPVSQVSFSADGQTLASVSIDGMVKIWSLDGREPISSEDLEGYYLLEFAPKNRKQILVLASEDNTIKLWDLGKGKATQILGHHSDIITSLKFSPDGKKIASASWDKTVKLWNIKKGGKPKILSRSEAFTSLDFSPDSQMLALASENNTIKIWRLNSEKPTPLGSHEQRVNSISFSPDGKIIASASDDNTVKLWSLDAKELQTLNGHNERVTSVNFSPDGKIIASASDDNTVKLWNRAGEELTTFQGRGDSLWGVSFSPDGKTLAAASRDNTVILWNLDLNKLLDNGCDWLSDYLKNRSNLEKKDQDICSQYLK